MSEHTVTITLTEEQYGLLMDLHATYEKAYDYAQRELNEEPYDLSDAARDSLDEASADFASQACVLFDTASSAARQHYIDTGRYLLVGEAQEV